MGLFSNDELRAMKQKQVDEDVRAKEEQRRKEQVEDIIKKNERLIETVLERKIKEVPDALKAIGKSKVKATIYDEKSVFFTQRVRNLWVSGNMALDENGLVYYMEIVNAQFAKIKPVFKTHKESKSTVYRIMRINAVSFCEEELKIPINLEEPLTVEFCEKIVNEYYRHLVINGGF